MPEPQSFPVSEARYILMACRADEPVGGDDPRYFDFSALRDRGIAEELESILATPLELDRFHHRILCGHRGSGKSTELLVLSDLLSKRGFLPVRMEVDTSFPLNDLLFCDLYLLAAQQVMKSMRDQHASIPKSKLEQVVRWFGEESVEETETTEAKLEAKVGAKLSPFALVKLFGDLFAEFTAGLSAGTERQRKIRLKLQQSPQKLIELVNDLLTSARDAWIKRRGEGGEGDLVLLFDNLDRYDPEIIRRLLFDSANLVDKLACHCVFTMPINLHYGAESPYQDYYEGPAVVLPMLPLRKPDSQWGETVANSEFDEQALGLVLQSLNRRIQVDKVFESPTDAQLLVKHSGGCLRDLFHLVALTYQKTSTPPGERFPVKLTTNAVTLAIRTYRDTLTAGLLVAEWGRLAEIARRAPNADQLDDVMLKLLKRRLALRYFHDGQAWVDVHPMIIEDRRFQDANRDRSSVVLA